MTIRNEGTTVQQGDYPVDNNTYNLLQIVTSKLEAVEAYQRYLNDADEQTRSFLEECLRLDRQTVQQALELLRTSLAGDRTMAGVR
jgi:hypothetical protein